MIPFESLEADQRKRRCFGEKMNREFFLNEFRKFYGHDFARKILMLNFG